MGTQIVTFVQFLDRLARAFYVLLQRLNPSKTTLRGILYVVIAYLTSIVQMYKPDAMTSGELTMMHLSSTLAALLVLRAFVDQTISQEIPVKNPNENQVQIP